MIVAVAEHARLAGQLVGDLQPFVFERRPHGRRDGAAAIGFQKMLREEIQLPHQLVAIERDAEGNEFTRFQLTAAPLEPLDELDGLLVQRVVLDWLRHAEMRLQRDIAEILEDKNAEIAGMPGDRRNRKRHVCQQARHVDERQLAKAERRVIYRQHHRWIVGAQHPKILPRGRVAGQRHDAHLRPGDLRALEARVDLRARLLSGGRSPIHGTCPPRRDLLRAE